MQRPGAGGRAGFAPPRARPGVGGRPPGGASCRRESFNGRFRKGGNGWSGDGHPIGTLGSAIDDEKGKIFVALGSVLAPSANPTYLLFPLDPKQG